MSENQPPSWFKDQEPDEHDRDEAHRRRKLLEDLHKLRERKQDGGRAQRFEPYLLIRSVLGDRGDRPINVPFWESPDIWTAPGDPATSPDLPSSHGGTVVVGQPNTVYAHVWNLGFAPLAGVLVEFYWFDPSLGIDGAHAHLIGTARCELAGRGMAGSHRLVKCTSPWVPILANGGHECLVARVSGMGDPVGGNPWSPWLNRHVGQRNISVVPSGTSIVHLVKSLDATRVRGGRLQLVQVGKPQGRLATQLVAPRLHIPSDVVTHVLGEVSARGQIALPKLAAVTPAMMPPVHALAHGVEIDAPTVHQKGAVALVDPSAVLGDFTPDIDAPAATKQAARGRKTASKAKTAASKNASPVHLADLMGAMDKLHGDAKRTDAPGVGEAVVLRFANYDAKGQLVGGYTLVVGHNR